MIGFFKFFLSLLVISSHLNIYPKIPGFSWFNQGVFAVIGFYLFSGFFTSLVLEKKYSLEKKFTLKNYIHFFLDKFKKIAPQYYFFASLTFIFLFFTKYQTLDFSITALISNLLIIPLNLFEFIKLNIFKETYYDGIIPAAWYLGSLFQYYLIAPILYKYKKIKIATFILSLTVFLLAIFNIIPSIFYGVRFLGGGLLFFLIGDYLFELKNKSKLIFTISIYSFFLILTSILLLTKKMFEGDINGPVIFGFLILFPIVFWLTKSKLKKTKLDTLLSHLSFTIYLNHFPIYWIFDSVRIYHKYIFSFPFLRLALTTFTSVILALFVQKLPFLNPKPKENIFTKLFHKFSTTKK